MTVSIFEAPAVELKEMQQRVVEMERKLGDLEKKRLWRLIADNFWGWLSVAITLFFMILFAAQYLHSAGIFRLDVGVTKSVSKDPQPTANGIVTQPSSGGAAPLAGVVLLDPVPNGKGDFRDLLTILVPMFAAGVAFVVSAAGMRRLQSYDDEIARARDERRVDEKAFRAELATSSASLRKQFEEAQEGQRKQEIELRKSLEERTDKSNDLLKKELSDFKDAVDKASGAIVDRKWVELQSNFVSLTDKAASDANKYASEAAQRVGQQISDFEKDYSFLKGQDFVSAYSEHSIVSVGHLHSEMSKLIAQSKSDEAISILKAAIAKPERMVGDPNDWFNISAVLGRSDDEYYGLLVCDTALNRFGRFDDPDYKPNIDLLAHAIQFATKLGEWAQAQRYVDKAENLNRSNWNWRLFVFIGDYFDALSNTEAFKAVNEDFKQLLPFDEHPYSQMGGYWERRGQLDKSLEVLEEGITKLKRCSRLLLRKADILLDMGRYVEVIAVCARALETSAEEQPGIAVSAIAFMRANALDSLFFQSFLGIDLANPQSEEVADAYRAGQLALKAYAGVLSLNDVRLLQKSQSLNRVRYIQSTLELLPGSAAEEDELKLRVEPESPTFQKPLSVKDAKRLTEQLAEQLDDVSIEQFGLLKDSLVDRLRSDFSASGLIVLANALTTESASVGVMQMLREVAEELADSESEDGRDDTVA